MQTDMFGGTYCVGCVCKPVCWPCDYLPTPLGSWDVRYTSFVHYPRLLSCPAGPEITGAPKPLDPNACGKRCQTALVLMGIHGHQKHIQGYPWISMDVHGYSPQINSYSLMSMDIHWCPWASRDIHGYPLVSMDVHGYQWISNDVNGLPWICKNIGSTSLFGTKLCAITCPLVPK